MAPTRLRESMVPTPRWELEPLSLSELEPLARWAEFPAGGMRGVRGAGLGLRGSWRGLEAASDECWIAWSCQGSVHFQNFKLPTVKLTTVRQLNQGNLRRA